MYLVLLLLLFNSTCLSVVFDLVIFVCLSLHFIYFSSVNKIFQVTLVHLLHSWKITDETQEKEEN